MSSHSVSALAAFALVIGLVGGASAQTSPAGQSPVVGNWRAMTIETLRENGEISTAWMGVKPTGLITYQHNGLMAVQIMRDPKPVFETGSRLSATPDELKKAFFGYYAYWGTYNVNDADQSITHEVTASLLPEEVGLASPWPRSSTPTIDYPPR